MSCPRSIIKIDNWSDRLTKFFFEQQPSFLSLRVLGIHPMSSEGC